MITRFLSQTTNVLWGDVGPGIAATRMLGKILVALALAWLIQECALVKAFFGINQESMEILQRQVAAANEQLASTNTRLRLHPSPPAKASAADAPGVRCPAGHGHSDGPFLAIEIERTSSRAAGPSRCSVFFVVERRLGLISEPRLPASIDTLMRSIEAVAFNGNEPPTEIRLCFGTRSILGRENCRLSEEIEQIFRKPVEGSSLPSLAATVDHLRIRAGALVIGPVQFATLAVFVFILIEAFGLGRRWVHPKPTLYQTDDDGRLQVVPAEKLEKVIQGFATAPARAIGDRLFGRVLAAGRDFLSGPAAAGPAVGATASPKAHQGLAEVLESVRSFLRDDAESRQEPLDTLNDTMLKIAFLGTVFGIGQALYSARGLDSADPLDRLIAKSEMYAGIGIGFGATLVGIFLSIVASLLRSGLARAWSREISAAYGLVLDHGVPAISQTASGLDNSQRTALGPPVPMDAKGFGFLHVLGVLMLGLVAGLIAWWLFTQIRG